MITFFRHTIATAFLVILTQFFCFSQNDTTWISNWVGDLYTVDVDNCQTQLIGTLDPVMQDLAFNPADSLLYGLFSGSIYVINTQNASSVYLDAISQLPWNGFFTSMTCDEFGVLFIITDAGFVYTYNTATSTQHYLGDISQSFGNAAGDLTFYNGELVLTSISDELVTVNLNDLASSFSNGTYVGISSVFGIVSYTDCESDSSVLLAMPDNDIFEISYPSLNTILICDNLVPGVIYGAATTSETGCNIGNPPIIDSESPNYIEVPNVFTPNGDLQNDVFQFNNYSSSLTEFRCKIVNRWGQIMTELTSIFEVWDGTDSKGDFAVEGTYFCSYEAVFQNGETINGHGIIQLIR